MTSPPDIEGFADALLAGSVVAVPTDTVYGLAVVPSVGGAAERVFALKRRPDALALPVLVDSLEQARRLVAPESIGPLAALSERFWPGPLTVVVARGVGVELHLGGDSTTVGLRCPDRSELRALCSLVGPLAVTSANVHGSPPCTTAEEVRASFGEHLTVLDGGTCAGTPSTVVLLVNGRIELGRTGPVAIDEILAVLDQVTG